VKQPLLPLVVVVFYSLDDRQDPTLESKPGFQLDEEAARSPKEYILPYLLLAASGFWLTSSAVLVRSTHICPITGIWAIPKLSALGFALDCLIVVLLYSLLYDRKSDKRHGHESQLPTNTSLLGAVLISCSGLLATVGGVTYAMDADHRYWMLNLSRTYLQSLFALSLTISCTISGFLGVVSMSLTYAELPTNVLE
jgi:hypothetical protein